MWGLESLESNVALEPLGFSTGFRLVFTSLRAPPHKALRSPPPPWKAVVQLEGEQFSMEVLEERALDGSTSKTSPMDRDPAVLVEGVMKLQTSSYSIKHPMNNIYIICAAWPDP